MLQTVKEDFMVKLGFLSSKYLPLALVTIALISTNAYADIYKWRNARGVVQYSDRPPLASFTKATRNEIINALQAKDVCILPNSLKGKAVASAASTQNNAFFGRSNSATNTVANNSSAITNIRNRNSIGNSASNIANHYRGTFAGKLPNSLSSNNTSAAPSVSTSTTASPKPQTANTTRPVTIAANTANTAKIELPAQVATAPASAVVNLETSQSPNIVQVAQMPAVDISKNITPALGYSEKRIVASKLAKDQAGAGDGDGQFRITCEVSHMANDDPMVYPNQSGAAHHHTFFGNTTIDFKSDLSNLSLAGNSTCMGGTANRSAYWVPSMIDTSTNTPIKPIFALWYYKTGYTVPRQYITAPPKGLRIIAGNMKAITAQPTRHPQFTCFKDGDYSSWSEKNIPNCKQGRIIVEHVSFPQCWDGVNLDSPDHKSHMAEADVSFTTPNKCPASHPIAIPAISLNIQYQITAAEGTANWRLSSDNYAKNAYNAGYSAHADWVNGWDEKVIAGVVKNCLNTGKDCGSHMLGDGTIIY